MTSRGIIMQGASVRGIIDGRKTQTRRVKSPQPERMSAAMLAKLGWTAGWEWEYEWWTDDAPRKCIAQRCPFAGPGDLLWVREAHALDVPGCERGVSYRVDHRDPKGDGPANPMRWRSPIHMPRWASRLTLRITDVRVQLVQGISEADAIAEGIPALCGHRCPRRCGCAYCLEGGCLSARDEFSILWDGINRDRAPWTSSPWVWAISFERQP